MHAITGYTELLAIGGFNDIRLNIRARVLAIVPVEVAGGGGLYFRTNGRVEHDYLDRLLGRKLSIY